VKRQRHVFGRRSRRHRFSKEQVEYIREEHAKVTRNSDYLAHKTWFVKLWKRGVSSKILSRHHTLEGVRSVARREFARRKAEVVQDAD
jgi:hypothetical protein